MQINCYFFTEEEIEMDVDPKEISSKESYESLLSFLEWLSSSLGRNTYVTFENSPAETILIVEHGNV